MSEPLKPSELLTDLSEKEQENLTGGLGFFIFQQTAIDTFAENQSQISGQGGSLNASFLARTGYSFRQTTLAFASFSFGRGKRRNRNPFSMILNLFQGMF
ncbi:MAG: hypothetical protein KME21_14915 [Desmonostoc vinosum HA7617-LM4]|jgi:hypothetical protein|nr:hypothetical protein [Desmonostoc vinosum HA7617-LM4]